MNNLIIVKEIIKNYKFKFILWFSMFFISNILLLVSGFTLSKIFNYYENKLENKIWFYISFFLITLILRIFFVYKNAIISAECRFIVNSIMRSNFLRSMLEKPGAEKDYKSSGEVINSFISDTDELREYIEAWINCITFVIFGLIAFFILALVNWRILIISIIPIVSIILLIKKASKYVAKFRLQNRKATGAVTACIGNIFNNILTIKLFSVENEMYNQFIKLNEQRRKTSLIDNLLSKIISLASSNAVGFGTSIVMMSMIIVNQIDYSLNEFVLFTYYMTFISMSVEYLSAIFVENKRIQIALKNISKTNRFINIDTFGCNDIYEGKYNINLVSTRDIFKTLFVKNIEYQYEDTKFGISDINFKIERGTITVISGKIGSGKSTLIRSLLGLLDSKGEIYWNDNKNNDLSYYCKNSYVSYSPQVPHFFYGTLEENITLNRMPKNISLEEAICKAVLIEDIQNMPHKKMQEIGVDGEKLSGGQRQRLSVARMLYADAELYIVDDISSALDINTSKKLWDNVLKNKEKTFIIVSNRQEELQYADQIIFMDKGKISQIGNYNSIVDKCMEFRELVTMNNVNTIKTNK